jgi:hypothetical protein
MKFGPNFNAPRREDFNEMIKKKSRRLENPLETRR